MTSIHWSKSVQNVCHCYSHLQIRVFRKREDVLFYCISHTCLLETMSDISLYLHTDFSDVRDWLIRSGDDEVKCFLQKGLTMHRQADFSERVDSCNFEVEARIFSDYITKFRNETRYPIYSIDSSIISYSLDSNFSNCPNSIFEEIKNERLQVFWKEIIVLSRLKVTCTLVANYETFLISYSLTLHLESSEQAFKLGLRAVIV